MPLRYWKTGLFAAVVALALPLAMPLPIAAAADSEADPKAAHIQLVIADAWADATATWEVVLGKRLYQSDTPQLNFVPKVNSSHCYGLYINPGPVYCSGNATVFVSLDAMQDIKRRYPQVGDVGLAFLVAHELGHHVQKLAGRFRLLSRMMRFEPERRRELALRFELEADCLAGVWAARSPGFASVPDAREMMLQSLIAIGDDHVLSASGAKPDPATFTHGSGAQRTAWFKAGLENGSALACDVLKAESF